MSIIILTGESTQGMISDALIAELHQRLPNLVFERKISPEPVVTIHPDYPILGDLKIYDEGGEATIIIGDITHSHFNPYEPELTQEEVDRRVAEDVTDFLDELLHDRVLLWVTSDGQVGGWKRLNYEQAFSTVEKQYLADCQFYLWSGPIHLADL